MRKTDFILNFIIHNFPLNVKEKTEIHFGRRKIYTSAGGSILSNTSVSAASLLENGIE